MMRRAIMRLMTAMFQTRHPNYKQHKYLDKVQPSQISQEFSVAEKTGPAIDDKLAQLIADLLPKKLPKTKLEELKNTQGRTIVLYWWLPDVTKPSGIN